MRVYLKFTIILYVSVSLLFCINNYANSQPYSIGQKYRGGIIFYIDDTGLHGLIAALADQGKTMGRRERLDLKSEGVKQNLKPFRLHKAQDQLDDVTIAKNICNHYSITISNITYNNWYLPSKKELNLIYAKRILIGGFKEDFYWSSTLNERDGGYWLLDFSNGDNYRTGRYCAGYIRPIQAF